jgi:hypothetical protein
MIFINKKEFDDIFNIKKDIDNSFLKIETYHEDYYCITYDKKIYDRLIKLSKISHTDDNNKKYIEIIIYCLENKIELTDIHINLNAKILAREIDRDILRNLMDMSTKKTINDD